MSAALSVCLLALGSEGAQVPPIGWRPPTEEEKREYDRRATRILEVRLNPLGRRRMNAARRERAKAVLIPESEVVAFGEEIAGAPRGREAPVGSKAAPDGLARDSTGEKAAAKALPAMVDNSALSWFPPIRSQGTVASCTCFAATYYQMTHMTAMVRGWDAKTGGEAYRFSPKWTYNLIHDYGPEAPSLLAAHCLMMDHGAASWAEFPHDGDITEWCIDADVWRRAIGFRVAQVGGVTDLDTDDGMLVLKQLLVNGFVLVFPTYILSWQYRAVPDDASTTDDDPWVGEQMCRYVNGTQGGHGMTIVGYNDHIWCDVNGNGAVDAGEKGALKVAGSWGTSYGNGGYYWICFDALKAVSAVANGPSAGRVPAITGCTARWMTARASYVPRMVAVFRVRHDSRWQMSVRLGKSVTVQTLPSVAWEPYALTGDGGDFALDGSLSPCDGDFALDFSDLAPDDGVQMRYYCGMSEHPWPGTGTIKEFRLVDASGAALAVAGGVPLVVDGTTDHVYIDHAYDASALATVEIVASDAAAGEAGADAGTFTVTRTGETSSALTVNFALGGSASYGGDYVLTADSYPCVGSVVIPAGSSSVDMTVIPLDDWALEGTETAVAALAEGAGYSLGAQYSAAVAIADDEKARVVTSADVLYVWEGSTASFEVRLSAAPGGSVSVSVERRSGDADVQIVGAPRTLEFDPANWDSYQPVELIAAQDADRASGSAVIRCWAPGLEGKDVTATEMDDDVGGGCSSVGRTRAGAPFSAVALPLVLLTLVASGLRRRTGAPPAE